MAGGNAANFQTPYPKGEDALVEIVFGPFDVPDAAQSGEIVERFTVPFAFKAVKCEATALDVTAGGTTFFVDIFDDTSSPKEIVKDATIADVSLGAGSTEALTVVKTVTINAGALLTLTYDSASGDSCIGVKIRLWVQPVF
jgi:hypothetical protein